MHTGAPSTPFELKPDHRNGEKLSPTVSFTTVLVEEAKNYKPKTSTLQRRDGVNIKREKPKLAMDYKAFLAEKLRDPQMAAGYLSAALEEGEDVFLLAIRDVAEAFGGVGALAKSTRLNREGLYDKLSESGNPRLSSLSSVISALGLKLVCAPTDLVDVPRKPLNRKIRPKHRIADKAL